MTDPQPIPPPLPLDDPALGEYVIAHELGGGGMSRLFLATERRLGRRVVIKVLAPTLAETLSVDRFRREILVATSLQHPNIVPVLSAGEIGGAPPLPFFVMPYIEGESLRARLLRGPLSVREAVIMARDVARALAYAHERGIVHRDIKPGNVLLATGAAMVSDFGVAKAVSASRHTSRHATAADTNRRMAEHASLTAIGTSLGTPAYMAPEQAAADPNVDHRADIYALGVVLYEMLVGTPPFHGRMPQELLRAQLAEAPPPIATRRYDVPQALAELLAQCLEKDPVKRPQSTTEVLRRLEDPAVLSGAFAVAPVARARSRRSLAMRGGAVAVLLAAATTWWVLRRAIPPEAAVAMSAIAPTRAAPARHVVIGPLVPIGGDREAAAMIEGLTSELATVLVAVPGLRVGRHTTAVPGPAASSATGTATGAATASAATPANAGSPDSVPAGAIRLEGTVQRAGNQLRILLRAVDTGADSAIWSGAYDGRADSVLVLQGRVALNVASMLEGRLSRRPVPPP